MCGVAIMYEGKLLHKAIRHYLAGGSRAEGSACQEKEYFVSGRELGDFCKKALGTKSYEILDVRLYRLFLL